MKHKYYSQTQTFRGGVLKLISNFIRYGLYINAECKQLSALAQSHAQRPHAFMDYYLNNKFKQHCLHSVFI
jgi:hypothetical protein